MRSIFLALAIILGWSAAAQALEPFPEGCKLVRRASLPFAIDHGHIMVEVAVNDYPLHFIVDTGGAFSAITAEAADAAGLHPSSIGHQFLVKDAGGAEHGHIARIKTITLDKFRSENLTLLIVHLAPGEDGILAPDLLRNFDIELNFATQTMNLFKEPRCSDHVVYWTDNYSKLPLEITEQGHIRIPVSVNGQTFRATVDTGSPLTLISDDAAKSVSGDGGDSGKVVAITGSAGGKLGGRRVAVQSLAIGKFKWMTPNLTATADRNGWQPGRWRADGSGLLLGLDIVHDLHVFIDYKGEALYVSQR